MSSSPRNLHFDRSHLHHHSRFPSLSEFPDSPSIYSYAYQSPDANAHPYSPSRPSDPEFDDESASTVHSSQDDSDLDDSTDDASHRISLRGPRIRFHSRAPWETDDAISRDELDTNSRPATFGSKLRGKASRADSLIRTLTRGSSISSRPSVDSVRSQISATSSFEVTAGNYSSSRGALYDLAKESMSSSSFVSPISAPAHQQSFARANTHLKPSRSFTQAPSPLPRATATMAGMAPLPASIEGAPARLSSSDGSSICKERSASPSTASSGERQSRDEFVHPYANPDLVTTYTPSPQVIPSHPISGDISGSDSNSTIADTTSIRSATFSVVSTETSTSLTSRQPPYRNPCVSGKEISSPVPLLHHGDSGYVDRNTRFLSLHPPPPGFDDPHWIHPRSPTVALITLQEAQERERIRGNTIHTTVARQKLPFPDPDDITEDSAEELNTAGTPVRTRARSTSAGTRYKTVPVSPQMGQESTAPTIAIPARTLKHKKSGFMRLFTGRNSEGEKEKILPPIPSSADVFAKQSLQIHGKASNPMPSRLPKYSSSPTLHASGVGNATLASTSGASSSGDSLNEKGPSSRRRQLPPLSIVTTAPDRSISSSAIGRSSTTALDFTPPPPLSLTVPQSAPPGDTDFPGLKLRPVSTSFSSHFADMVASTVEDLQRDVHTPSSAASSSTALSPFTPLSIRRSDDASTTGAEGPGEDHLTIKGLQDQFVSAKKAWQQQIWELRGQIRDLTSELEDLREAEKQEYCETCGRGKSQRRLVSPSDEPSRRVGVVNRPRARTGDTARFAGGN